MISEILQARLLEDERVSQFTPEVVESLLADFRRRQTRQQGRIPADVVRLNSRVIAQEANKDKEMELTVAMPDEADIKQRKISVMVPVRRGLYRFSSRGRK